jgi:branched-chain amino acid transport system substrate-binding protein
MEIAMRPAHQPRPGPRLERLPPAVEFGPRHGGDRLIGGPLEPGLLGGPHIALDHLGERRRLACHRGGRQGGMEGGDRIGDALGEGRGHPPRGGDRIKEVGLRDGAHHQHPLLHPPLLAEGGEDEAAIGEADEAEHLAIDLGGGAAVEVALALEPWAARLHTPFITPGAASNEITRHVKEDYAHNKYTFHGYLTSTAIADANCDFSHDFLVEKLGMKTTVMLSEDAAWTKPLDEESKRCLPKAGLTVLDSVRVSPDTTDFTPIFNKIEGLRPDVITTGISHVGVQPTVQWHSEQVPVPMSGVSSQATTTSFWRDTNGATEGVIAQVVATPDVAITPKTIPYAAAYLKRFGVTPAYTGYTTDDDVHIIAEAVGRAGSDDADKIVAEMEKTNYVGTIGTIAFYGQDSDFPHGLKYGADFVSGLMIQWQDGKQVTVWPARVANGTLKFPSFIKLPTQHASAQ